jgi:uncharacterized protein (DUF2147 family)
MSLIILLTTLCCAFANADDSIVGKWKTIDDETGKAKSIVEIYQEGETFKGRVLEILLPEDAKRVCSNCKGEKFNKPILGLEIISNIKEIEKNKEWGDGEILDPKNGKTYKCRLKLKDPKTLEVRGYIGISLFGRSQTWYRPE